MGIAGLLPVLKPIQTEVHLQKYKGEKIGVDAYVWLHRGAFGCAFDLATGKPTKRYVDFCMKRVRLLLDSGVTPVLVFDGASLPMKSWTEKNRREARMMRKSKGLEYLKMGDRTRAIECFQTCIDVTPFMAFELIKALKAANVEFIVAPYEADAQLAFLNLCGHISAVLTEDSDLISFGCTKVLYKLRPDGYCIEILKESLGNIKEMRFWSSERFRQMCILSGCDYLESLPGIGVKTAIKHLEKTDAYSLIKSWKTWGSTIKAPKMPPDYLESFMLADHTFQFQRVYDPRRGKLVTLNPIPSHVKVTPELMHAIGPDMDAEEAKGIAEGYLNPETKEPFPLIDITNKALKINSASNISPTLTSSRKNISETIESPNHEQPTSIKFFSESIHDSQTPVIATIPTTGETRNSDLTQFSYIDRSKIQNSFASEEINETTKLSTKISIVNQNNIQCNSKSNQNNLNNHQLKQTNTQNEINEKRSSNTNPSLKPSLPAIRSSYTKFIMGGLSKILPTKRKSNSETDKNPKPQKKISSFFSVPRLNPNPKLEEAITTENLITHSKNYSKNEAGKHERPIGVLNLLKPQKLRARRVGLAPAKKKL